MAPKLNHTLVYASNPKVSADFLAGLLGLPAPRALGPFVAVQTGNEVTLDYYPPEEGAAVAPQHYAFQVTEEEFDGIFERVRKAGLAYWADPDQAVEGRINRWNGGRGFYFQDPDGHLMEVLTRP